ncbi:unnamed protein product [Caenorhabditis bovis]|uniref:Elongation factor Ts, mitochondrial n=1 Tax=Caenorhabditis bovis TaxID=2654633 RepID=A0A8S1E833_9PELO|nr:unnamed protein product [Caenorhabditis bovis]
MLARIAISRFFSTTTRSFAEAERKVSKEALMALRKRTGYSYVNCRKALVQFGEDQMDAAEKWLREAAAKEGWAKAAKLGSRATSQGLVSIVSDKDVAAIVELTCETDFVARADHFKQLLQDLTVSLLEKAKKDLASTDNSTLKEVSYDPEAIVNKDGKNLRDVLSLSIGKLGENMVLKRLKAYKAPKGTHLYGSAHPKESSGDVVMGRFVSLIAIDHTPQGSIGTEQLAAQLCQHVIGMSPEKLGEPPVTKTDATATSESNDEFAEPIVVTNIDESETSLLRQSFMLNPSQSVYEYLQSHNARVSDFVRVELGSE